jgi:hypothetical protein
MSTINLTSPPKCDTLSKDNQLQKWLSSIYSYLYSSISSSVNNDSASQTVPSGSPYKLTFSKLEYDSGGIWNNSDDSFVIQQAGKYHANGTIEFTSPVDVSTTITLEIYQNGQPIRTQKWTKIANDNLILDVSKDFVGNARDIIQLYVTQDSGADLTVSGSPQTTNFQIYRI